MCIEKATSEMIPNAVEDLALNLDICDRIRSKQVSPKEAMRAIKRRVAHRNPNVQLLALKLADSCVKNAGSHFLTEIASREFMDFLVNQVSSSSLNSEVKNNILSLIQDWAIVFRSRSDLSYVDETFKSLRSQNYAFPPANRKADTIMIDTVSAPDWTDSDTCERCRELFTLTKRKHHCRNCGKTYCNPCSSRTLALPHFGINQEVRVCEICYNKLSGESTSNFSSPLSPAMGDRYPSSARKGIDASKREEEELQKAIALSLLESQEKPLPNKPRGSSLHSSYNSVDYGSNKKGKTSTDDDPELAAAIAASLRDMESKKNASNLGVGSFYPDVETASVSSAGYQNPFAFEERKFSNEPNVAINRQPAPQPDSTDLNMKEVQQIGRFHEIMDRMDADITGASSAGILHDHELRGLYDSVVAMHPKIVRGIEDCVERHKRLMDLHDKMTAAARVYDRLIEQKSKPAPDRNPTYNSGVHSYQAYQQANAYPYDPKVQASTANNYSYPQPNPPHEQQYRPPHQPPYTGQYVQGIPHGEPPQQNIAVQPQQPPSQRPSVSHDQTYPPIAVPNQPPQQQPSYAPPPQAHPQNYNQDINPNPYAPNPVSIAQNPSQYSTRPQSSSSNASFAPNQDYSQQQTTGYYPPNNNAPNPVGAYPNPAAPPSPAQRNQQSEPPKQNSNQPEASLIDL